MYSNFFAQSLRQGNPTLLSIDEHQFWDMTPHALALWVITLSNYAPPTIYHVLSTKSSIQTKSLFPPTNHVNGWTVSPAFESCIEALAQKLFISFRLSGGSYDLPLETHRLVEDFDWYNGDSSEFDRL